jgi:hypothetical protein
VHMFISNWCIDLYIVGLCCIFFVCNIARILRELPLSQLVNLVFIKIQGFWEQPLVIL